MEKSIEVDGFGNLLQNTKDAVETNKAVDICVEITDEHVRLNTQEILSS